MDSLIGVTLKLLGRTTSLILELRRTPRQVKEIAEQVDQLALTLNLLDGRLKAYIFPTEEFIIWQENHKACTRILGGIHDILWKVSKHDKSKLSLGHDILFYFGAKHDLAMLHEKLKESVEYFNNVSTTIMNGSNRINRLEGCGISGEGTVVSIGQVVQQVSTSDTEADEKPSNEANGQM